jgi:A/G-specific adenine glycosylase
LTTTTRFAADLLRWYDGAARDLPWRIGPAASINGVRADPYRVWLSEIMLQQTTVKAVVPYFAKFTALWPSVEALARADENAVLAAWAGLGYYSRARNLRRCAIDIAERFGGVFPQTYAGLITLPGVGDYTAAAIASIAFGQAVPVIDGNVERVSARVLALATPFPQAKPAIRAFVETHVPAGRPGDFAQAMMDLGATVCTPRTPSCLICPVASHCAARTDEPTAFPVKPAKAAKPARRGAAFVAVSPKGAVWLTRRAGKGLLAGMAQVPTSQWSSRADGATGPDAAPFAADWVFAGGVTHVFTHFTLDLDVWVAEVENAAGDGWWSQNLDAEALPALMRKAVIRAMEGRPHD